MHLFGTDLLKTYWAHDVEMKSMRRRRRYDVMCLLEIWPPLPPPPANILNLAPPPHNILNLPTYVTAKPETVSFWQQVLEDLGNFFNRILYNCQC